jgi:hypothetical protein
MNKKKFQKLTLAVTLLALTLSVSAAYVSYTPPSDSVTTAQPAKTGIDTYWRNVTTSEKGIDEFETRVRPFGEMDMRKMVIHWETPTENHTLTPAETDDPDELTGPHFTMEVLRDRNDNAPKLDDGTDDVQINIRPPTFLDSNESRLGPVKVIINAPGIFREKLVISNVTTTGDIYAPLSTPEQTPTPEDEWFALDSRPSLSSNDTSGYSQPRSRITR